MESLFGSETAKRRRLPPGVRRLIVDLKAEHPGLNPNEISRICCVRFGRRPARKTVKRVLAEEPIPLRFVRRFPPYHEIPERRGGSGGVARRRLERQGDLWLPSDRHIYRLPDLEEMGGARTRGPGGQAAREAAGREEGDAKGDGGDPPLSAESQPGRVSHPRGAGAYRHTPEPPHLRSRPRPQPRALRPGKA